MRHDEESVDAGNKARSKKARVEREKKTKKKKIEQQEIHCEIRGQALA